METFLQMFALSVAGVLRGYDRCVFHGKLRLLYSPEGMHWYLNANRVLRKDFKEHAFRVTGDVLAASLVGPAKKLERYRYLNSCKTDKCRVAQKIFQQKNAADGLVCVLQCVEPCWTFDKAKTADGKLCIVGEKGQCTHLYHYYIHPVFGWMYVRLQTWFPFEIQIGINGREWLARQMDREKMSYRRSDNKFLWVEDWQRAQQLADQQLQTDWVKELNGLQQLVHPLHPGHLGRMPLSYNWTVFQSEWATDIAFHSEAVLSAWFDRWLRQAFLSYESVDVLRYLNRASHVQKNGSSQVETTVRDVGEGKRIKHAAEGNSVKAYTHFNVFRPETTINQPKKILVLRASENDPEGPKSMRPLPRNVKYMEERAAVSQAVNERYLTALATLKETRTVKDLVEPLTQRVAEPPSANSKAAKRQVRGLNPLGSADAALLTAVSDPKWTVQGIRNRDLVACLYTEATSDAKEKRKRSAHVTRLLRILRAHGLIEKVKGTHRYQVSAEGRANIQASLAVRNANPEELISNAA